MVRTITKLGRSRPRAVKRIKGLSEKQTVLKQPSKIASKRPVFYREKSTGKFTSKEFALKNPKLIKEIKVSYRDKATGRFTKRTAPQTQEYVDKRRLAGYMRNPGKNFRSALETGALSKNLRPDLEPKQAKLAVANYRVAFQRWKDLGRKGDAPVFESPKINRR